MIDRWLARALVASFLVNCLLAVWLWSAKRPGPVVREAERRYVDARVIYDSTKAERLPAIVKYRTLRDTLNLADTVQVKEVLARADTVIAKDSVALAAADSALARADELISALRKSNRPKLIQPFAEILYSPYSREYVGRGGIEVRTIKNLSLVVAGEARRDGPQAYVGARIVF